MYTEGMASLHFIPLKLETKWADDVTSQLRTDRWWGTHK